MKFHNLSFDVGEYLVYSSAFLNSRKEPASPTVTEFMLCKAVLVAVDKCEIPDLMGNRNVTSFTSIS